MPFTDPIVAGSTLVRDAIQSEDYQPGAAGWIIRRDGSAEFNTGTYRGAIIINGADGLPAVTINADGILTVDNTSGSAVQIAHTQEEGATLRLTGPDPIGLDPQFVVNDGYLGAGLGNVQQYLGTHLPYLLIEAPFVGKSDGSAGAGYSPTQIQMYGMDLDGSGAEIYINARTAYVSDDLTVGNAISAVQAYLSGALTVVGALTVGVIQQKNPAGTGAETWHNMALNSPFTARGGAYPAPRYKLAPWGKAVILDGHMSLGNAAQGAIVATLPVGYRPPAGRIATVDFSSVMAAGASTPDIEVDSTGAVRLWGNAGAGVGIFNGFFVLD